MGATGARAVPGLALPAGLPSPSAGYGPTGGATLTRQPGTPKGAKDDMLDETFIDVITPPSPLFCLFMLLLPTESTQQWLMWCLTLQHTKAALAETVQFHSHCLSCCIHCLGVC